MRKWNVILLKKSLYTISSYKITIFINIIESSNKSATIIFSNLAFLILLVRGCYDCCWAISIISYHILSIVRSRIPWSILRLLLLLQLLFNRCCYCKEGFLYIVTSFGTGFKELHVKFSSECLSCRCVYHFFVLQISFIADENLFNSGISMQVDLSDPITYIVKGVFTCTVICQNYTHCPFVIGLGDGSEPLLASSVPNLELHILTLDVYGLYLKVNSYRYY